jgi:predicted porin
MRTRYLHYAISALGLASAAAHAQTSVILYGRLDAGFEYLNHIANDSGGTNNRWRVEGGDWGTSILGFKGTEGLGDGLSAIFTLETAPQLTNGTTGGGRLFSRRAFTGLSSKERGTLQAGRNLFIDSDGVWEFDPFVQQAFASASLVRGRNWQQSNNNVEYHSPVFAGVDVQGQYAFGNQTSFNSGAPGEFGRSEGVMVTYHSTPLDLRGIYDELRNSNGKMDNIFVSSREVFLGSNIRYDKFKIQAAYSHYSAPDTPVGLPDSADQYWLGATYSATPSWAVTGAVFYVKVGDGAGDATHDPSGHATLYALGTTYNFTKRTFLYGTVAYVRNSKTSAFSLEANARGEPGSTMPLAGQSQTGAYVGILHSF